MSTEWRAYVAEIGEIVRSHRRDDEFIEDLSEKLSKVTKELLGQRKWIRWFPYLRTIASSLYYSNTIGAGCQTLGEEYIHLFESDGLQKVSPSIPARFSFVLLHSMFPLISSVLLQKAETALTHPSTETFLGVNVRKNHKARKSFIDLVNWIRSTGIPHLQRAHIAVFYITGTYYSIARRITGIRFLSANPQTDIPALKVYRFLGYITIAQLIFSVIVSIATFISEEQKKSSRKFEDSFDVSQELNQTLEHSWFTCSICLEKKDPSALFCGHIFCWNCIQEHSISSSATSSSTTPRCPQCRLEFLPRDVTPLLNL